MANFQNKTGSDETWNISIDVTAIANSLIKNPAFIAAIAKEIRIAQTKQVRSMGNLYGHAAQQQKPAPTTKRRLR
jgi:hypothetical protein